MDAALFLTASAVWGSTWLAIKYQLGVVAPEWSVAYRFALAALVVGAFCAATGRSLRFSWRDQGYLVALGVTLFGLNYICVYQAERFATSGLVAVVFSTITFMNPVGMRLAFGTPVARRGLLAAALGVSGVALLFLPELLEARHGGNAGLGVVLAIAGTVIACVGNMVAIRNNHAGIAVFPATAWGMFYGALVAAIAALVQGASIGFDTSVPYLASLAYLTVFGSIVAFGAYLTLLKRVGGVQAAFVSVATPVLAMLLSTLFEGYRWTWVAGVGVALAVLGNWLAVVPAKRVLLTDEYRLR